jgi:hypothetical protein
VFFIGVFSAVKKWCLKFLRSHKKHQLIFLQKILKRNKKDIFKSMKAFVYKHYNGNISFLNTFFLYFF